MNTGRSASRGHSGTKGFSAKPYLVSLLCHAAMIAAIIVVAALNVGDDVDVIEVEIVEILPVEPQAAPPPEAVQPSPVPAVAAVRMVDTPARPYQAEAKILNQLRRDVSPSVVRPAQTPLFAIPMEATIDGGGGFEVVAVADVDAGMHGDPNVIWFPAVEYAETWEITAEPEPLNDRDFKPVYPSTAKAQGVEASVEVELLVDSLGTVAATRVLVAADETFSESALQYCNRLKFRPALANQTPVASRIVWVVDYRFGDR